MGARDLLGKGTQMKSLIKIAGIIAMSLTLWNCGSPATPSVKPSMNVASITDEYRIGNGDALQINVWKNPELSVAVPVRPDGKISLPLVGDITASGETAQQLGANIASKLNSFIRNPQVTVIVTNPSSADFQRRIRVTGAVNQPISVPYREGMTILDLVLEAGGLTEFASANKAKLYRKEGDSVKVYPVYLNDILNKGKLVTNYQLVPSDIVTIPERAF